VEGEQDADRDEQRHDHREGEREHADHEGRDLVGEVGGEGALPALLDALSVLGPNELRSPRAHGWRRAWSACCWPTRWPGTSSSTAWPSCRRASSRACCAAPSALPRAEATLVATRGLARSPDAVLEGLSGAPCRAPTARAPECAALARTYLYAADPARRARAACAVAHLADHEAPGSLIALLDDPDPRVRRAARVALVELTGVRRAWDPEAWDAWWRAELGWLEHAPRLTSDLARDDPFEAVRAVRELQAHPLFATQVATHLEAGLQSASSSVRCAVYAALATLRCARAIDVLVAGLDEDDPAARAAALAGLQSATGLRLGSERAAWNAWWDARR
jgi:hypothetical protein